MEGENAANETFSTLVRRRTRKIHSISDALVNTKFALSLHNEKVWAGGLYVFYHVFQYLEGAKERLKIAELDALFFDKSLFRAKAIEHDLDHYLGPQWRQDPLPKAVQNYLSHLQELETSNPAMLSAYVYHLYLGLLSGGQILARKRKMFGKSKNIPNSYTDHVTNFEGVDLSELKTKFRDNLNQLAGNWSEKQRVDFISESNRVFVLNNSIVASIESQNDVLSHILIKSALVVGIITSVYFAIKMIK